MSASNITTTPLVYNGEIIHRRQDMLSLTDMWKAAGSDPQKAPAKWRDQVATRAFLEHVELTIGKNDSDLFVTVKGGRNPGTMAHWQVGLAYAKYLSPEFHMWCNSVVRERMEGSTAPQGGVITAIDPAVMNALGGMLKGIVHKQLADIIPGMVDAALTADPRAVATEYRPALSILVDKKVPARKRRAFSQKVSSRLRRLSVERGYPVRISRESGRYLFHTDAVQEWLRNGGEQLIADHNVAAAGQHVLPFSRKGKPQAVPTDGAAS